MIINDSFQSEMSLIRSITNGAKNMTSSQIRVAKLFLCDSTCYVKPVGSEDQYWLWYFLNGYSFSSILVQILNILKSVIAFSRSVAVPGVGKLPSPVKVNIRSEVITLLIYIKMKLCPINQYTHFMLYFDFYILDT